MKLAERQTLDAALLIISTMVAQDRFRDGRGSEWPSQADARTAEEWVITCGGDPDVIEELRS